MMMTFSLKAIERRTLLISPKLPEGSSYLMRQNILQSAEACCNSIYVSEINIHRLVSKRGRLS
jgi:hypothetical protein